MSFIKEAHRLSFSRAAFIENSGILGCYAVPIANSYGRLEGSLSGPMTPGSPPPPSPPSLSKGGSAKKPYTKPKRLIVSCRVTWAWSERVHL
jgi:hypothetical protein